MMALGTKIFTKVSERFKKMELILANFRVSKARFQGVLRILNIGNTTTRLALITWPFQAAI